MAQKATIRRVNLAISDISRGYYADHALTLAQQPSETALRILVRLAVFALNASDTLELTKGLADADEPDLWQRDLTGQIEHWIELGQPSEKRLRQSCGKAARVSVYTYQKSASTIWYGELKAQLERFKHLHVVLLTIADEAAATALVERTMDLSCVIEDGQILLSSAEQSVAMTAEPLKAHGI